MSIACGTAGWTDRSLIACRRFYPRGCSSAEARLRYYATQFPLVEVDSAYYAMPSVTNAQQWAARTPDGFTFNVKAFRLFTGHPCAPDALPRDIALALPSRTAQAAARRTLYYRDLPDEIRDEMWRRYRDALEPLRQAGRLGAVLFQCAPWVARSAASARHIDDCAARMGGHTLAVEFRHPSWLDDAHAGTTLAFLRERGLVHVIVDAPSGVRNRAHIVWDVTSASLALVRLHGRNAATWDNSGAAASGRFDYDYSDAELDALSGPIRAIAARSARTHVIFNNCFEDQGQRNARTLMRLLGDAALAPPT